jgi:4-hydroxy-tetrahydrodipicolinate reductase
MALKVAIHGAAGRMGRALVQLIAESPDLRLASAIDAVGSPHLGKDAGELAGVGELGVAVSAGLEAGLAAADVVIDFSLPAALAGLLAAVEAQHKPLVVATTGLLPEQWSAVDALAKRVPLIAAPNYSTGVAVLYHLAEQAARLLPEFDLEIVEMHHRHKVDAPSGTALGLAEAAARGRDWDARKQSVYGREGRPGARPQREIGVMTLRGGDVIGDHTLVMAGDGERLELSHKATSRVLFARGALRAARWLVGKPAGRYGMSDVLGLT